MPSSIVWGAAALIIVLEVAVAVSHLVSHYVTLTAPVAMVMLGIFFVGVATVIIRGDVVPCLCFGAAGSEYASVGSLVRIGLLMLVEVIVWWRAYSGLPGTLEKNGPGAAAFAILIAATGLLTVHWLFNVPRLYRLQTKDSANAGCLGAAVAAESESLFAEALRLF